MAQKQRELCVGVFEDDYQKVVEAARITRRVCVLYFLLAFAQGLVALLLWLKSRKLQYS